MIKADLHNHSTVSDGSKSMDEIVEEAARKGLDAVAITDHDTVSHLYKLPVREDIQVIGGVEISAYDKHKGYKVHILAYNIQKPEILEQAVKPTLEARHQNCLKQIHVLQKQGYTFDLDDMKKADGTYIYKQHIMEYLVRTGQVPELFGDFYQKVFKNHGVCDFDITYPDPFTAVKAVVAAGGTAVLAHSGQQQNFQLIPELEKCGLRGLECNHPANSEKDIDIIRKYANVYELFLTGGSDSHGDFEKGSAAIGEYLSEESGVEAICGRVEDSRAVI